MNKIQVIVKYIRINQKHSIVPCEKDEYPLITVDESGSVYGPDPKLLADGWEYAFYDQYNAIFHHRKQMDIRENIEDIRILGAIECKNKEELLCEIYADASYHPFDFSIPENLEEEIAKEVFDLYILDIGTYKYYGEIMSADLKAKIISIYSNQIKDEIMKALSEKDSTLVLSKEMISISLQCR